MKRRYDLGIVAAVLALYPEVVFGSARMVGRDALLYLLPVGAGLRAAFRGEGSFWWDSALSHGVPVAARWAPAVFYPGQWLNAVFVPTTALAFGVLIHLVIAGCAAMRLALRYTDHLPSAWIAGFSFACGGYVVSVSVGGGYLYGATLLPLGLLALHRLAEAPTVARMAQLAGVLALQVFCADPQTIFYEGVIAAPLIVLFHRGLQRRVILMGALAAAFALALSTCQWLPSSEFSGLSTRADGISVAGSAEWAFHPLRLVQFWSPHVLGSITPQNTFWARSLVSSPDMTVPWAALMYVGLLPWVGLLAADWKGQRRLVVIAAIAGGFLLVSFGGVFFRALLTVLPGARFFRYPEKFMLFVSLAVCVLGAAGLGRWVKALGSDAPADRSLRVRVLGAAALLAAAACGGRLWLWPDRSAWFAGVLAAQRADFVDGAAALPFVASSLVHTMLAAGAIALVCAAGKRVRPELLVPALLVFAAADVIPSSLPQRWLADGAAFDQAPATCAAIPAPARGLEPLAWRARPNELMLPVPEAGETRFAAEQRWYWNTLWANTGAATCIRQVDGYDAATLRTYAHAWKAFSGDSLRRLQAFGTQWVIAQSDALDPRVYPRALSSAELELDVHQVPDPLPYAHAVADAEAAADPDAAAQRAADPAFDFRSRIVVEGAPAEQNGPAVRTATLESHREGEMVVVADFAARGWLMLQESHYPGWQAATEQGPLTIHRANGHFLAVPVPAGKHTVRFSFDPPLQRRANVISALSLVALVALVGAARWRRWDG